MTRVLLKLGGAQLERAEARAALCASVAAARADGIEIVVVHGGGNQIRELTARLGLTDHYHEGLRITDAATADIALMVLGGLVNRTLVGSLQACGVRAVGLTGADGGLFSATPYRPLDRDGNVVDLGFVGTVAHVDPAIVDDLLGAGYVPVIASVGPLLAGHNGPGDRPADRFFNINADTLAGILATHLRCSSLMLLTDVPGVRGEGSTVVPHLSAGDVRDLIDRGVIQGGMVPKVRAALQAAVAVGTTGAPVAVKIASAAGEDAVRRALRPDVGTVLIP